MLLHSQFRPLNGNGWHCIMDVCGILKVFHKLKSDAMGCCNCKIHQLHWKEDVSTSSQESSRRKGNLHAFLGIVLPGFSRFHFPSRKLVILLHQQMQGVKIHSDNKQKHSLTPPQKSPLSKKMKAIITLLYSTCYLSIFEKSNISFTKETGKKSI